LIHKLLLTKMPDPEGSHPEVDAGGTPELLEEAPRELLQAYSIDLVS
jgi:hypothetical protein